MKKRLLSAALALLAFFAGPPAHAQNLPSGFTETVHASWLNDATTMAFAPDGRIFVCLRGGALRVVKNGVVLPTPFATFDVDTVGEHGLVGVAVDPDFGKNLNKDYVYVTYTARTPNVHNRISRLTANGDVAVPGSELALIDLDDIGPSVYHAGGGLSFGADGKLYIGVGDNAMWPSVQNAQLLTTAFGKILRINSDGSIPTDNPYYSSTTGIYRSIWATGLRNPFTHSVQSGTGRMFINDVGGDFWEEINEASTGANFGWPAYEGPSSDPNYQTPFYAYGHDNPESGAAIVGGAFYNPTTVQFPSQYVGKYFFLDWSHRWIKVLDPDPATKTVVDFETEVAPQSTTLRVGPDGCLYYLSRWWGGHIFKIANTGIHTPQIGMGPYPQNFPEGLTALFFVRASGDGPLSFQWKKNGVIIPGATSATYITPPVALADNGSTFQCVVTNSFGVANSPLTTLTVTPNRAPAPVISAPAVDTMYNAGDTITFAGSATDPEDGALGAARLTWEVHFQHETHWHPFMSPTTGITSGTFAIPQTGETAADVWYRIYLTATDSAGVSTTVYQDILPNSATLSLATEPLGLNLTLDGLVTPAPYSMVGVVGMVRELGAPTQTVNGITYALDSWSDGGDTNHDITMPAVNTTYTAIFRSVNPDRAGTLAANPNPITVTDGSGLGVTTLSWTSVNTTAVEIRLGSPNGPLFFGPTSADGSETTGKWVTDGTTFYLQDVSDGLGLTSANTLATVTVNLNAPPIGTLAASPNPITVSDGSGLGVTTLSWTSVNTTAVEVHVGSPSGPLFFGPTGLNGSATTGKWVADGTRFYLQNVSGGLPLTAANTLATLTVNVDASTPSGTLTASPNPISVTDGSGLGVTTLGWTSLNTTAVEVHVGSPSGPLFFGPTSLNGSATTGKWVTNGTVFYLQNVSGGLPLTAANTLATVTVSVSAPPAGTLTTNPNPITVNDGSGLAVTTLNWTSVNTSTVEVRVGAPNGTLLARSSALSGSATTGKWVGNGTTFYLQNVSGGLPLTSSNTLAVLTVSVFNNHPPVATNQSVPANEDTPLPVTLQATDADSQTLTYSILTGPAHGTLSGTAPNLTYTPAANYNGQDSFTFKVNDSLVDSNVATVSITVNPVNDPPVAANQSVSTNEDTTRSVTLAATDVDSTTLTFSIVAAPARGTLSGTAPNLTYTPAANYNGGDSFTFKANDGVANGNVATVSITVNPVNDAPVARSDTASMVRNTSATIQALANDTDVDGDTLTVASVTQGSRGSVTIVAGGASVRYTPNRDYTGTDAFNYTISDGHGGIATATVTVTVTKK